MGLNITTKRIELDGEYEGGWVDISRSIPTNTLLEFINLAQNKEDNIIGLLPAIDKFLVCIKAWNFTDEKDKDIKCNSKNIKKLPLSLKMTIVTKIIEGVINSPKAPKTNSSDP